jgi:hypothetical protein
MATAAALVLVRAQGLRRRLAILLGAGAAGSMVGGIIVWLAPGNEVRQAGLPPHPPLLDALTRGLTDGVDTTRLFLQEPAVLVIGLVAAVVAFCVTKRPGVARSSAEEALARDMFIALVLMQGLITVSFAVGHYFLRDALPDRAWVTAQVTVMVTIAYVGYRLGAYASSQMPVESSANLARAAAVIVGAIVIAIAGSTLLGQVAHRDELSTIATAWDDRDAQIRAAHDAGEMNLVVEELDSETNLYDVSRNPELWSNVCVADYYGIETIRSQR